MIIYKNFVNLIKKIFLKYYKNKFIYFFKKWWGTKLINKFKFNSYFFTNLQKFIIINLKDFLILILDLDYFNW